MPAVKSRPKLRLKLEAQIDMILSRPTPPPPPPSCEQLPSAVDPQHDVAAMLVACPEEREPFGRWLVAQRDRGDWIDMLANAARSDPRFPKSGTPDEVRKHLNAMQAEGDMFEAIDDAELDWLSL